jgi:hypothetical protein
MLDGCSSSQAPMFHRGHFSNQYSTGLFWKNAAPSEHVVQFYRDERILLDALEGFVGNGLRAEPAHESVMVIATAGHLHELEKRLRASGIDVDRVRWQNRYFALLAEESLRGFMVNGWPDEALFAETIRGQVRRAKQGGRKVRVFGEMVSVLWGRGLFSATLRLEQLWTQLAQSEDLLLFCAYPVGDELSRAPVPFDDICAEHSRVIPG